MSNRRTWHGKPLRFCSYICAMKAPWNTIEKMGDKNVAKREDVREKFRRVKRDKISGKNHYLWKGDLASYSAIHMWLKNHYGKAATCENRKTQFLNFECSVISFNYQLSLKKKKKYNHSL